MSARPAISVIVPVLDEAAVLAETLAALQPLRAQGHEVIVVDGGSTDVGPSLAGPLADRVLRAARGRALQMNAGAAAAAGDVLLFLHADTRLPAGAAAALLAGLARSGRVWGRFDVRLSGARPLLRVVEWLMNLRSRLSGIATGDQAIFAQRRAFEAAGGYPEIALMEDLALSRRLGRISAPVCLAERVITSSRRWEQRGVLRTVLLMWGLRLAWTLGAAPERLARRYERRT